MQTLRFQLLITRLVYQDAARYLGFALGFLLMLQVFVMRYIPPWDIRDVIQQAYPHRRSIFLLICLFGYAALTRPVVRVLIGSERLRFFRHLPVSSNTWSLIHLRHLWMVNLLCFGIAGYGLWTGAGKPTLVYSIVWWLAWTLLVHVLQVAFLFYPPSFAAPFRTIAWLLVGVFAYQMFLHSNVWMAVCAFVVGSVLLYRWLRYPPPLPMASTWRLIPGSTSPWLGMLRLQWLALQRQSKQTLWLVLFYQALFAGIFAIAMYNNRITEPVTVIRIAFPMMLASCLAGASVVLQVLRIQVPSLAWRQHLPIPASMPWGTQVLLGGLGALPTPLLFFAGCAVGGVPFSPFVLVVFLGLGVGLAFWCGLLVVFVGYRAQRERCLEESLFFPLVMWSFWPLLLISFFPWAGSVLPLWAAWFAYKGRREYRDIILDMRRLPPAPTDVHVA